MAQYIVKGSQNIYDIAVQLYGSIEGVYDLLISNSWLDMDTDLKAGMELSYHDYFVINGDITSEINSRELKPANLERKVYWKSTNHSQVFQFDVDPSEESAGFMVSGEGVMTIDWGDNSDMDVVNLQKNANKIEHHFDNIVDGRTVKIYGDFTLTSFSASGIHSQLYALRNVTVDEFTCNGNNWNLDCLFLFDGTYLVNLMGNRIHDLSPIVSLSLQKLDLRYAVFDSPTVLDDYLVQIVENYGNRRNCEVLLSEAPGERGMEAINTIISETEWNASGAWVFNINGNIITAS